MQEAELPYSYKDSVEHYKDFVLDGWQSKVCLMSDTND